QRRRSGEEEHPARRPLTATGQPVPTTPLRRPSCGDRGNSSMQIVRKIAATACTVLGWMVLGATAGHAAEGGFSDYFPRAFGSFLVAVAPQPGLMLASQTLIYGANVNRAVLDGRVDTHLNTFAVFDLLSAAYTGDVPMLGGRFQLGGFLPVGHVSADFRTGNGSHGVSGGDTNIGDLGLVPASFFWDLGDFHVKAAEII